MKQVVSGDTVVFICKGFLGNGRAIDIKEDNEPFKMVAGKASRNPLQRQISHALIGMTQNESKDLHITPQNAFGERDPSLVLQVARQMVPSRAREGDLFPLKVEVSGKSETREAVLIDVEEDVATVDFNHPFAGHEMVFKISVISFN